LGNLLDRALSAYAQADLDRQLKARFFIVLCLVVLSMLVTLIIVGGLIQYLTVSQIFPSIIVPLVASIICILFALLMLIRGHFFFSANLLVIIAIVTIWTVILSDPGSPLARLDSFIFIIGIIGLLPLVVNERRSIIFVYGFANIILLFSFILFSKQQLMISNYDAFDFLCDSTLSVLGACFIASSVFAINRTAIQRANAEIEERKHAEEKKLMLETQLHQAQKMEAIGQLAGGVAHDFNNMLSVVIGNTELIMMQQQLDDEAQEQLEAIRYTVTRSAALIRQLLAFARKQTVIPEVLDINQTVSDIMPMLHQLIEANINLEWLPGEVFDRIMLDPSQMDQVLTNLVINARDAISNIGNITIETRSITLDKTFCVDQEDMASGPHVMLAVSDNGCGMNKEVQDQIFEPFFSTKQGQGTGLGLATIYGIVKQNSGHIKVDSHPGHGTTFKIYFPIYESQEIFEAQTSEPPSLLNKGTETILMVEDNKEILQFGMTVLEQLGYTVLGVDAPEKAIELVQSGQDQIDLLLTDVVMPQMNGQEMAQKIKEMIPGIKCLYISGYTANALSNKDLIGNQINFLAKPFSIQELAGKVRQALS